MRILITGASGYVGSALIQRLLELEQDEIYALDLHPTPKELTRGVKLIKQDLTRYDELNRRLEEINVDVVVHLAAKITGKPYEIMKANVIGTSNLLEITSRKHPRLVVVASTAAQLYRNAQYVPIDEKHPVTPVTPYGLSKYLMEKIVHYYHRVYGLPTLIFRQTNVYGPAPNQKFTVINKFVEHSVNPRSITIHGDGKQVRNFIHINDLTEYYVKAIYHENPDVLAGETMNISGPQEYQIREIAEIAAKTVSEETGIKVEITYTSPSNPPVHEVYVFKISMKKAKKLLNYESKITVNEGIAKLIKWRARQDI
jgi:UDP-glucose 4-epimerase